MSTPNGEVNNTAIVESATLGAIIINNTLLSEIDLTPEIFCFENNKLIFESMLRLYKDRSPIDLLTLEQDLQHRKNVDYFTYLADLCHNTPSAVNGKDYAKKVKEFWKVREVRRISFELNESNSIHGFDCVDRAIRELMQLNTTSKVYNYHISEALNTAITELEKAVKSEGKHTGLPTGIEELDKITGGMHKTDLIVVGARPAMGKTALLLNLMSRDESICSGICSSEQGHSQIGSRFLSIHGSVNGARMRAGELDDEEWSKLGNAVGLLKDRNIWINDKPGMSIADIERQARKWRHENQINALGVDYLQKIKHEDMRMPTHERIGDITMRLKDLAKELDLPVVALAQVNRKVEERSDKRPGMSDIKDSGIIEQEADQIMTVYREQVYDENADPLMCEIGLKKNRHGPIGTIRVVWQGKYMQFNNYRNPNA